MNCIKEYFTICWDWWQEYLCTFGLHWSVHWSEWKQHPDKKGWIFRWCENCGVKIQERKVF